MAMAAESMGACLIANDIPFTGLAKDLFDRRVQGQSWKQIADEFNLGSPSSARKLFTKTTGITDYKIKGDDLLKLAKGGLDPKLTAPKLKKLKMAEEHVKETTSIPNKLGLPGEDKVIELWKQGIGQYTKLSQETGLSLAEVDQIVWREALRSAKGDVWKAHKIKNTSQEGIKAVRAHVFEMRSNGYTVAQIVDHTGIPQGQVEQILGGQWMPSMFQSAMPGHPAYKPVIGRGARPVSEYGSKDFPLLTDSEMRQLYGKKHIPVDSHNAISYYTGSGYGPMNKGLRAGTSTSSYVPYMDSGMVTTTQPFTVTRGMGLDGFGMGRIGDGSVESIKDALTGTIVSDPGYLSTSIAPGGVFQNNVRLVIEVPKGAKGMYVQEISHHKSEYEFILARNTNIMITEVTHNPGSRLNEWVVKGRVVVGG